MSWGFVYVCAAFICHGQPPQAGDGHGYESKYTCLHAALPYAILHDIKLSRWEPVCTERAEPKR